MKSGIEIEEIFLDKKSRQEIVRPLKIKRLMWFYGFIIFCLLILLIKIGYLQIFKKNYYQSIAEENRIRIETIPAPRGIIYDQNGKQIVQNILSSEKKLKRNYVNSEIWAHLIGYTDYENKGQTGLELVYDNYLQGQNGKKRIEVDALENNKRVVAVQDPEPGDDLILNIDAELQKKLYDILPEERSAGVILDAQTGAVLALVSKPSFDSNLFAQGINQEKYQELINSPDKPLFNRAISGQYPPGSTIKPLMAVAALEKNLIDPWEEITDVNSIKIRNQYNPDIIYNFPDWKDHGQVNMVKAIKESCNIYFYKIGEKLGWKNIEKYADKLGLGQVLGIDLPNEAKGHVPQKGWLGDLYHIAIGQGDLTITVLQLASYTAAIANNGKIYQPQILDKVFDKDDNLIKDILPQIIKSNAFNFEIIKKGMDQSTEYGKTGTAQFSSKQDKYHAWYTSFKDNLVVTILVEEGKSGQQTAMPIAKAIYKWYYSK